MAEDSGWYKVVTEDREGVGMAAGSVSGNLGDNGLRFACFQVMSSGVMVGHTQGHEFLRGSHPGRESGQPYLIVQ